MIFVDLGIFDDDYGIQGCCCCLVGGCGRDVVTLDGMTDGKGLSALAKSRTDFGSGILLWFQIIVLFDLRHTAVDKFRCFL